MTPYLPVVGAECGAVHQSGRHDGNQGNRRVAKHESIPPSRGSNLVPSSFSFLFVARLAGIKPVKSFFHVAVYCTYSDQIFEGLNEFCHLIQDR
jgi:hypothetical protein